MDHFLALMSFLAVDDETLLAGKARYDGELYGVVVTAGGIECVSFDTGKRTSGSICG